MSQYLVNASEQKTTGRGSKYVKMTLFEPGGKAWQAMWWSEVEPPPVGKVVDVLADIDHYEGKEQLKVTQLRITDIDPSDVFLPKSPYNVEKMYAELEGFLADLTDKDLYALCREIVADPRWKRAPAAIKMHHAYLGGLLEHTVNLCRLAKALKVLYPVLNLDWLLTAAILHDSGKMDEMQCGVTIDYTTEGELIGHITIGLLRADALMEKIGFDPELRMVVRHLVISHHGQAAFGSPKSPKILEAQVFCNMDGIDANIGKIVAAAAKAGPDKEWSDNIKWDERFYLGKVKVQTAP